jgi:predicted metal-dependent peptidase
MNTMNDVRQRLSAARAVLVLDHPFFGALALRMAMEEETQGRTRTMATDGRSIFYDQAFVKGCSDLELIGLLAHEVMHPAMQHHTRRGDRDLALWNDAADYAINPILTEAGFTLPGEVLNDLQYRGMTAEQIYDALNQPHGGGHEDEEAQDPDGTAERGSDNSEGDGSDNGNGDDPNDGAVGDETDTGVARKVGAVLDAPDPAQQEAEWQVAVKQATQAAQMMGQLPGGMALVVEEATRPRIAWKAILRRFVQQFASADYSWRMPNRRYVAGGVYLPELRSESMPVIVVAVDTSASTSSVLPVFKAELQSIVDECQPEATLVMMADATVQRVDRFERGDPIEFNVEGLGGTDFRPVFEYVDHEQVNPACLIYLTDGDGCYPDQPSDCPTLWAITTPSRQAPWGETVNIDAAAS